MSSIDVLMEVASPHTRGWTASNPVTGSALLGFPAHAGMDPAASPAPSGRRRLPRTRGDGPLTGGGSETTFRASPHTRGWTRVKEGHRCPGPPATASSAPEEAPATRRYRVFPHECCRYPYEIVSTWAEPFCGTMRATTPATTTATAVRERINPSFQDERRRRRRARRAWARSSC